MSEFLALIPILINKVDISGYMPAWLPLQPNEEFVGQGQFKAELDDDYKNHWIIKAINCGQHSYHALVHNSKVRLDKDHVENAIKNIKDQDDTGWRLYEHDIHASRPLPIPLLKALATTNKPSIYSPMTIQGVIDLDDDGNVLGIDWTAQEVMLPRPADRTSNVLPTLAWDNTDYAIPSDKKHFKAWKKLLLQGFWQEKKSDDPITLNNQIDKTDPAIMALVRFLESGRTVDLSTKPKSLLKPRVCYRHAGKLIPQCESIQAMATELLGDMNDMITQSPMTTFYRNPIRIFSVPVETNISYGIIPTLPRGLVLSAFDNFKKHKENLIKIGNVGVMLYRDDGKHTPLVGIFTHLLTNLDNDMATAYYQAFKDFEPDEARIYKLMVFNLTSKGVVECRLACQFSESYFFETLKRSINLTTTLNCKKPICFYTLPQHGQQKYGHNLNMTAFLVKYMIGMTDDFHYQFVTDVKFLLDSSPNSYIFYMRKHFLKSIKHW